MNRTIANFIVPFTVGAAVVGIGFLAYRSHKTRRAASQNGGNDCSRTRTTEIPDNRKETPSIDDMLATLEKKALAYAVFREVIGRGTGKSVRDKLYAQFGYVNLPPSLEEDEAFRKCPQLMTDKDFLTALNRWIVATGGLAKGEFFSAATEAGRILVEAKREEARQIVDQADIA